MGKELDLYSADIFGQGGVFRCGKVGESSDGGSFQMWTSALFGAKNLDFSEGVGLN